MSDKKTDEYVTKEECFDNRRKLIEKSEKQKNEMLKNSMFRRGFTKMAWIVITALITGLVSFVVAIITKG